MSEELHGAELFAKAWLETAGYRIAFRTSGWTECLVWLARERWLGRGADEVEALSDTLRQMLPSRAARLTVPVELSRLLDDGSLELAAARSPPVIAAPPPEPEPPVRQVEAELAPVATPLPELPALLPTGASGPPEEPAQAAAGEVVAPALPAPTARVAQAPPPPRLTVAEAVAALEPLQDRIAAEKPELGLTTPQRQRLVLTSWICHARAIEDASGEDPSIVSRVAGIARDLTSLCKVWWPGSVVALQLSTTPNKALRTLPLPADAQFTPTWEGAASAAELVLARMVEDESSHGRDEYGWADGAALQPHPNNPEAELTQLRARVEKLTGPIASAPPKHLPDEKRQPGAADLAQYLEWGRLIRWLRGCVVDFETWSHLMGRLRWLTQALGEHGHQLAQVLDPAFRPSSSWASVLGRDPEEKKKKAQRFKLYRRADTLKRGDREEVRLWLTDALNVLDKEAIVRVLQAHREVVLTFVPEEVAEERGDRRRVRKIQEALTAGAEVPATPKPEEVHGAELHPLEEEETAPVEDPGARLFASVRPHTEGRHIIFVSNRNDPSLEALLRDQFGFAEIDWCDSTPRRIQTTTERISSRGCDYVLAATGFQSHSVDGKLYDACKRAGVPYLRVNKGRPVACAVAFARGLVTPEERLSSP